MGLDGLHPVLLKSSLALAYPIYKIFLASLDTSNLSQQWKMSEVVPIFKKGSRPGRTVDDQLLLTYNFVTEQVDRVMWLTWSFLTSQRLLMLSTMAYCWRSSDVLVLGTHCWLGLVRSFRGD
ncbi:hypothetical protein Pmani_000633 [Petrolisthes manimaculis]|uniref:Uncharacterized protein n=1 Tax=Petrolisthes manimaculis TaxID=1843537 RepID=A0AAE1UM59_9EUCA|nr:hypothetical protein Pmani_000633 [Petrolisthes manimaculis]